jgi:hypothetical protein
VSNPLHAETDQASGSRWYIHPTTGERFISVTTVLGNIARFGLNDWAAKLSAEAAFEWLPWLTCCADVPSCNIKGDDACGNCRACAIGYLANRHNEVRDAAGDLGSKLHDAAEQDALFGQGARVDSDVLPFLSQYERWRDAWKPTFHATEMTVISRKWGYAGTLDWIAQFADLPKKFAHLNGLPVLGDTKTGKHVDIPKGWQVVAYAKADAVLLPDGSEVPMPAVFGGLLLHIRPDRVQVREVHLTDANHGYFVHMLRVVEGLGLGLNSAMSRPYTLKELPA